MKNVFLLIAIILLTSCPNDGEPVNVQGAKADFSVELLFEKDGVKIYRFIDAGRFLYFSTGKGRYIPQEQSIQSGKTQIEYIDGVLD